MIAATPSSLVEWTRNAGACVTPFISPASVPSVLPLLKSGRFARATTTLVYYARAHTRVLSEEESTTASDRGAFTKGRRRGSRWRPAARPARGRGQCRDGDAGASSPSPAATSWRSRARLRRRSSRRRARHRRGAPAVRRRGRATATSRRPGEGYVTCYLALPPAATKATSRDAEHRSG